MTVNLLIVINYFNWKIIKIKEAQKIYKMHHMMNPIIFTNQNRMHSIL